MATLEAALYSELVKTGTSYYSLIGNRIYPLELPQVVTLPATVYQRISTVRYHALQEDAKLSTPRLQLDHYSSSYGVAKSVAEACRSILQNHSGSMGAGANTVSGVAVLLIDEDELYEDDTKYWRIRQDYKISFTEN